MEELNVPRVTLNPLPSPGRTETIRELSLKYTHKVGRSVPNKANCKTAADNAIFDSKVLSRSHAEIWHDDGKVSVCQQTGTLLVAATALDCRQSSHG